MSGRPARAPVRTASVNSAPRRIRDWDGRIRHSAFRGPCADGPRGPPGRPGCACAAGNHASSRGADCSAGTCAYSLGTPDRVFAEWARSTDTRAALGFTPGYHLEPRRLPPVFSHPGLGCGQLFSPTCHGHRVQPGSHVHNMWKVLWIVSACSRHGDARGAHRWLIPTWQRYGHDPSTDSLTCRFSPISGPG